MRILFITDFLSRSHFGREPLGILYLISILKKNGFKVDLFDISEIKYNLSKIKNFNPNIIGYSIKTGYHNKFIKLNQQLKKEFRFISLFGGPHATFCPEIINEKSIDIICRGEADRSIINLVLNIENNNYIYTEGFWIKHKGKIYKNPLAELVRDLDSLPFPYREILDKYKLFKKFHMRNFISSRGCPYECFYCHNYAFKRMYRDKGDFVRRRSVENLIEEIKLELIRNKINFINFEDDIFVQDKKWLEKFSVLYSQKINLPFHCHIRPDIIDEYSIFLLKKAGCFSVSLGIETANESLREKILNKKISNKRILEVCSMIKSYKINIALQNMLGIPDTKLKDDLDTLRMNIDCKADYSITSMFTPYPGTKIADKYHFQDWDKIRDYYYFSVYLIEDKKERENLRRLFAIVSKLPFLLKFISILIKLPMKNLYNFIDLLWKYFWGRKKIFHTDFDFVYTLFFIKDFIIMNKNNKFKKN